MAEETPEAQIQRHEYRFVVIGGLIALAVTSIPYAAGARLATDERVFGGFVYAVEDCYSYLAKMRQGAEGAWLFHLPYTPEPHPGALIYPFYLLLGKLAAFLPGPDLTTRMVWVYHAARWVFGLGLLLTVYRFLAALSERVRVRRLAWVMVTFGAGLGWLLIALGQANWLGSMPLDLILPEGFTFLVLYGFPHIALGRTLLLWGLLFLLRAWGVGGGIRDPERAWRATSPAYGIKWAAVAGLLWLLMGLVVPFYVAVAWAVVGAGWVVLAVREALGGRGLRPLGFSTGPLTGTGARKSAEEGAVRGASQNPKGLSAAEPLLLFARGLPWGRAALAGIAVVISAPIVVYSGWRFMSHPVYWAWGAQNQILSPHPLHYVAAYGVPLALAAFAVGDAWRSKRPAWLALAWVGVVPLLVYLPFNLQRRLVEGVQVPLSLLAAKGLARITNYKLQITNHKRQTPIHKSEIPKSKSKTPRLKGQMPTAKSQSLRPDRSSSGRDGSRDASESGGFDNPPGAPEERPSGNPLRASLGRARLVVSVVVVALVASNAMLVAGNTMALRGRPSPIFRDAGEVAALDWLSQQVEPDDVVLASYETGNYLPARVGARAFVGHGPESVDAAEKKALVTKFFDGATEDSWREELLREYGVDAVFWGPAERELGGFEPHGAYYLRQVYEAEGYAVFAVDR